MLNPKLWGWMTAGSVVYLIYSIYLAFLVYLVFLVSSHRMLKMLVQQGRSRRSTGGIASGLR